MDLISFYVNGIQTGAYRTKTLSVSKNTIQNMLIYDTPQKITPQNKLTLSINEIKTEKHTINGNWIIDWYLEGGSDNISLDTDINILNNNGSFSIKQIYLSPLSLALNIKTDSFSSAGSLQIVLHTAKGDINIKELRDDKSNSYSKDSDICELYYRFNQIQNLDEDQYIELAGI